MVGRIAYGIYQRHRRDSGRLTGLLNGPFGFLYDEIEAAKVACSLYGEDGVVRETNPDHFGEWGFGRGYLGLNGEPTKPFDRVAVGGVMVDLLNGEHPHSRSSNNHYARFPDGTIEGFNGHRLLHTIFFQDDNYLKTSGLSGNEVRKGGQCTITINGFRCATFSYRDVEWAMQEAQRQLSVIHEFPIQLWNEEERKALVGRKIYYRHHPAVVKYLIGADMDVVIDADPPPFPLAAYEQQDLAEGGEEPEDRATVKDSVFSKEIFWWRK